MEFHALFPRREGLSGTFPSIPACNRTEIHQENELNNVRDDV